MRRRQSPTLGHIAGKVPGRDTVAVIADGPVRLEAVTDASGWFGFANVPTGTYTVRIDDLVRVVQVTAGAVARF
jgi:hypothetical protein